MLIGQAVHRLWAAPALMLVVAHSVAAGEVGKSGEVSAATREGNQVATKTERFTVISPTLIRLEHNPKSVFVDAPSLVAASRDWGKVDFQLSEAKKHLEIVTEKLRLRYLLRSGPFNRHNLGITLEQAGEPVTWQPGTPSTGNLGGTRRDLNGIEGPVRLGDGILSPDGWYVLDDSHSPIFDEKGWPAPRNGPMAQDLYFFGYGNDYEQGLRDFNDLTGRIPLPPRWALGVWLMCDWPLPGEELLKTVRRLRAKNIPLDVLVISGWCRNGWTSYDWDRDLFPDPAGFLRDAHGLGVRVALRIHPGGALLPADSRYERVAEVVGWDPQRRGMIFFDVSNRKEAQALTEVLLAPLGNQGVDLWWVDGAAASTIRWLGGQWWTSHLVFRESRLPGGKRGLILSPYGGVGSHRFPAGFSGTPRSNWDVLDFLSLFTATAGNVGMTYWAHGVGGCADGRLQPDLYVRWLQFGALSPITMLRTHRGTTPWLDDGEALEALLKFTALRRSLIPYLYSLANEAHTSGLPLCRPMYVHYPNADEAYEFRHQYMLGGSVVVAPIAQPALGGGVGATKKVWFPPGEWHDVFTGRIVRGPAVLNYAARSDEMPLFARAGSIIPLMAPQGENGGEKLIMDVYSGESGELELYADDGETREYTAGRFARCRLSYMESEEARILRIGALRGNYKGKPAKRSYEVRLNTFLSPIGVEINGVPMVQLQLPDDSPGWFYDVARSQLVARTEALAVSEPVELVFVGDFSARARELAYRLREVLPRLESAAFLLHQTKGPAELIEKIRVVESSAEKAAFATCCTPFTIEDLETELARIRQQIAEIVEMANRMIKNDAVKLEFMKVVLGISITSRIIPSPYRQVIVRSEIRFLSYGWAAASGTIRVQNQPPHTISLLEPGGDLFFETTVPVEAIQLRELTFPVQLDLTWSGVPLNLAAENILDNTFIKQYYVIGPFGDGSYRRMTQISFPPERRIELGASYAGKKGQPLAWKKLPWEAPVSDHDGRDCRFVDLGLSLNRMPPAAGYALAQVFVPRSVPANLLLGGRSGMTIWANGTEVFSEPYMKYNRPDEVSVAVQLSQGWNTLLVKAVDEGTQWGFYLRLVGKDGRPIPDARSGWGPENTVGGE